MSARFLLLANTLGVAVYIFWQGLEKFWWESFGTWIISPVIFVRICPEPFKYHLLALINSWSAIDFLICGVPVVMFVAAILIGAIAYRKNSLPMAMAACVLMSTIFVVYHSVKHLGISFQII